MAWDNGAEVVVTWEGDVRGLFVQNSVDGSLEGWYCMRDQQAAYNWDCKSAKIDEYFFDPKSNQFPIQRELTSWWECGVEDKKTYTQA